METLEKMAENAANFKDELVYRGFVKDEPTDESYDFGDTWCMIAPMGTYTATNSAGQKKKEVLSEESLGAVVTAFQANPDGVYLDKDHESMRGPLERDTQAYGWVKELKLMAGAAPQWNGLYARIEWTDKGKELIVSKSYRFLSPVFTVDGNGNVTRLTSVALTNRPNFSLPPILNTDGGEEEELKEPEMNTEEIIEALKTLTEEVKVLKEALNSCAQEKKTEEVEKTKTEEKPEETKPEEKPEEKEEKPQPKKEMLTEDVLNSTEQTEMININMESEWRNLKGKDLIAWATAHPYAT